MLDQTSWRLVVAALSVVLVGGLVIVIGVMATPSAPKPTPTPAAAALAFEDSTSVTPTPRVIAVPGSTTPVAPQATAASPAATATPLPTAPIAQDVATVAGTTPTPWLIIEDETTDGAPTPIATAPPSAVPPTPIPAVVVAAATVTTVPATSLPTPTPVFLSPTPVPTPTATAPPVQVVAPPPTPTVAPPPATVLPTIGPQATTRLAFTAADWKDALYRGDAQYYGRPWVAIYGAYSEYPRATLSFTLTGTPSQAATVTITGLDDEWADLNQIALDVNGQVIFTGASPFPNWDGVGNGENAAWTSVPFSIPAGVLRAGPNDLTLSNLTPADSFNSPPYVLVSDVTLDLPASDGAAAVPAIVPIDANTNGDHQGKKKQKDDKSNGNDNGHGNGNDNGKKKGHDKNKHGR
jgi:hypothetical protein